MDVTLQRVLRDDELHKRVRAAVGSGRKVYERVGSDRDLGRIAARLSSDKDSQKVLRAFLNDLVAASRRLQEKPKRHDRMRTMILVSSAASAGSALAAVSGRMKEKPRRQHRMRTMLLVSSAVAGTVVVIRRRRSRDNGFLVPGEGYAPTDSAATQAPANAKAAS